MVLQVEMAIMRNKKKIIVAHYDMDLLSMHTIKQAEG